MTVHSCLYEGWVQHRRYRPVEHAFRFPLFMVYFDLDELPQLFRTSWLWSAERPALAWFRRADHLGPADAPLADCVRDLVAARTGRRPAGPIRLLTQLRYAGFAVPGTASMAASELLLWEFSRFCNGPTRTAPAARPGQLILLLQ